MFCLSSNPLVIHVGDSQSTPPRLQPPVLPPGCSCVRPTHTSCETVLLAEQLVDLVLLGLLFEVGVLAGQLLYHLLQTAALLALVLKHPLPLAAVGLHQVTVVRAHACRKHTDGRTNG